MPAGPLLDEDDAVTKRIFEINTYGLRFGARSTRSPGWSRAAGGTSSTLPRQWESHRCRVWSPTTRARRRLSGSLTRPGLEFRRSGVKFSCVLPGAVNTEPRHRYQAAPRDPQARAPKMLPRRWLGALGVRTVTPAYLRAKHIRIPAGPAPGVAVERWRIRQPDAWRRARSSSRFPTLAARRNYQDRVSHS